MRITKNTIETTPGPREWFTGAAYIDAIATPTGPSRVNASSVRFTPGARTAWHAHPNGQTIYVTERHWPRAAARRADRGDPPGRPRVLRSGRGALARRRADALHEPSLDGRCRREGQQRDVGRARRRRGIRRSATHLRRSVNEHADEQRARDSTREERVDDARSCSLRRGRFSFRGARRPHDHQADGRDHPDSRDVRLRVGPVALSRPSTDR